MLSEKLMEVLDRIQNSLQLDPKLHLAYSDNGNAATCWNTCSGGASLCECYDSCYGGSTGIDCGGGCWDSCSHGGN